VWNHRVQLLIEQPDANLPVASRQSPLGFHHLSQAKTKEDIQP